MAPKPHPLNCEFLVEILYVDDIVFVVSIFQTWYSDSLEYGSLPSPYELQVTNSNSHRCQPTAVQVCTGLDCIEHIIMVLNLTLCVELIYCLQWMLIITKLP